MRTGAEMKPITADYALCKELYDLGVRIDSYFGWAWNYAGNSQEKVWSVKPNTALFCCTYPAPQLHELLDVMPTYIEFREREIPHGLTTDSAFFTLEMDEDATKDNTKFYRARYEYEGVRDRETIRIDEDPNPANAVIKTLIWLIKEELVEVEKINERLS